MKRGFTLIELLVVVLIIGILAAVALPQYQKAVKRARMTQAQVLVRSIADSEVRYCLANGSYTNKLSDLDVEIPADFSLDSEEITATGKGYTFSIWLPADKSYAVAQGYYGGIGILQYVKHCGFAALECRTLESDSLGQSICLGMGGKYFANYEGELAYRL